MPFDDEIKDLFDSNALENEDWLEPSGDLFDKIAEEVYEEDPPKRRIFPLFLFGGILLLILSGILYYMFTPESFGEEVIHVAKPDATELNINAESELLKDANFAERKEKTNDPSIKESRFGTSQNNTYIRSQNNENTAFLESSQSFKTVTNSNDKTALKSAFKDPIATQTNLNNQKITSNNPIDYVSQAGIQRSKLNSINQLEIPSRNLVQNQQFAAILPQLVESTKDNTSSWGLAFSSGLSFRDFRLNEAYQTALNPADFRYATSLSWVNALTLERKLNTKFNVRIGLSYENIEFSSGHNSHVNYTLEDETLEHTNIFELTMASPIGFIGSSIVLERSGNTQVEPITDVIVDLDNVHRISQLNYTLGFGFNQRITPAYIVGVNSGLGISQIIGIKNQLIHFESFNSDFISKDSKILSDQLNVQKIRPSFFLGLDINRQLTERQYIGVSYNFTQDLIPVFQLDDFSSTMKGHQWILSFKQAF